MMYGDQHHHHLQQQQQPHPQHPPPPPPPQQQQPMMGEYPRGPQQPPPPPPPIMRQPSASSTTLNAPEYHHQPPAQPPYYVVVGRFILLGLCLTSHFADKNRKFEIRCKEHKAELKILSTPEGVRTNKFRGSETTVFECPYCPRKGLEESESRPVLDIDVGRAMIRSNGRLIALDVDLEYLSLAKDADGKPAYPALHDFDVNKYYANCARTNFKT